jgi:hypothetical protein
MTRMEPALPETLPDDTDFDLDVKLHAVAREVSQNPPKPTPLDNCPVPPPSQSPICR